MPSDSYRDAVDWLLARQSLGINPGLTVMRNLAGALGDPQHAYEAIHVAGTNGKGSVASYVASALTAAGRRTGLYTSPHLITLRERIGVDGDPITRRGLVDAVNLVRPVIESLEAQGAEPTFFETVTALAMSQFARSGVEWAVVEAGMGGGLDATNVITPEVTVITNVSLDHTTYLGDTPGRIAREKAGIIKPGVPVVTGAEGEALDVVMEVAARLDAPVTVVGADYRWDLAGDRLQVAGNGATRSFQLSAPGAHQGENATLAVAALDVLGSPGNVVPESALTTALQRPLPGRLECFRRGGVEIWVDGAHNVAAARAIADHLAVGGRRWELVTGFSADKDWKSMLEVWIPHTDRVHAVPIRSPRSLDPALVAAAAGDRAAVRVFPGVAKALESVGPGPVIVAGSLFLAGEARAILTSNPLDEVGGMQ